MKTHAERDLRAHIILDELATQQSMKGWPFSTYCIAWDENERGCMLSQWRLLFEAIQYSCHPFCNQNSARTHHKRHYYAGRWRHL